MALDLQLLTIGSSDCRYYCTTVLASRVHGRSSSILWQALIVLLLSLVLVVVHIVHCTSTGYYSMKCQNEQLWYIVLEYSTSPTLVPYA